MGRRAARAARRPLRPDARARARGALGAALPRVLPRVGRARRSRSPTSTASSGSSATASRSSSGCRTSPSRTRIALYKTGGKVELGEAMPTLEDLGLRVDRGGPDAAARRRRRDLGAGLRRARPRRPPARPRRRSATASPTAIAAVRRGDAESDTLNRLVLVAGLNWRQVNILRAYRMYRQRIGSRFTQGYQNDVLAANPELTAKLMRYFELRFDPTQPRDEEAEVGAARRDPRRPRRGLLARPRPHPAQPARADRRDAAHERVPAATAR